jgi:Na+-transporting methylmalonyl-CoA/oxaloacetate decarboxylase gamma subunit
MPEELHEMHEHAEHAHRDPGMAPVTLTMAILAVLVAVVSLLGHRAHTEEVLLQNKATDQWSFYQAKNIRRHSDEQFAELASVLSAKDSEVANKFREKYEKEAEHYRDELKELEAKGHELEAEIGLEQQRANRYDLGEVLLEIALVVTSITLMTGRKLFWASGMVSAAVGLLVAASGLLLH